MLARVQIPPSPLSPDEALAKSGFIGFQRTQSAFEVYKMINNKNNQQISIGGAIVFRSSRAGYQYLLVKVKEDGDWEIPKVTVRKGESSVRAAIRLMGDRSMISTAGAITTIKLTWVSCPFRH